MDEVRENCGLFGVFGREDAVQKTYLGLFALQHRGQESAGIVSTDGEEMRSHRGMGLVSEVFSPEEISRLQNPRAIGHVRYSTTGSSNLLNAQPMVVTCARGKIAVAHNGNLVNGPLLRKEFEKRGSIFQSTMDSEVILHLLARPTPNGDEEAFARCLNEIRGAYSVLFLTPEKMIAARDPQGFRPLCIGQIDGGYAVASESSAFQICGVKFIREVEPGEMVTIDSSGLKSRTYAPEVMPNSCIFEHVYFARPDSTIFGENVYKVRIKLGRALAKEHPAKADIVIPVPDSGNAAAVGYARESGIPFQLGFIRSHYVGRTFIQPLQADRDIAVRIKLNVVREVVERKRVVVIDDSVIRGTTSKSRVRLLREAGAREVHLRISCPPHRHPCHYGIDFPDPGELIANNHSMEDLKEILGVDSVGYLSLKGMLGCVSRPSDQYCTACWDGKYLVPVPDGLNKYSLES